MTQSSKELDQIKALIQDNLILLGKYDYINKHLKLKLYEAGWFDEIAQLASNELAESQKNNKETSFEELYAALRPQAESMVPESVKEEILEKINDYLSEVVQ